MVSTPASVARRIPSAVDACAATARPLLRAVSTIRVSSSIEKVGAASPPRPPAVVGVDLHPVGAVADLVAHDPHERAVVGLFGALRHAPVERVASGAVTAGGDDGACGDQQPRAGHDALLDRLLQLDVGVAGALGAQVAQRREAGQQRSGASASSRAPRGRQGTPSAPGRSSWSRCRDAAGCASGPRSTPEAGSSPGKSMISAPAIADTGRRTSRLNPLPAGPHRPAGVQARAVEDLRRPQHHRAHCDPGRHRPS